MKRLIYLGYYIKQLDVQKFKKFLNYTSVKHNRSKLYICVDVVFSSLRYNISILEYFLFDFINKDHLKRQTWAGTGYMYEYQRIMNPLGSRNILDDKTVFHKKYNEYFVNHVLDVNELKKDKNGFERLMKSEKLVLKESNGKCGLGTFFIYSKDYPNDSLISYMEEKGYDLAEVFIEQHKDLNRLSPSGVNTIRIFTQITNNGEVEILGCRQRISVNSEVDNLAAGNLAAVIDEDSGIIIGHGVYSDITKPAEEIHPLTKEPIIGFKVPFWNECLELVKKASLKHPQNKSVGWDVVVTSTGPGLIEGNHDWCKLVWQLPVNEGLKYILDKHLKALKSK